MTTQDSGEGDEGRVSRRALLLGTAGGLVALAAGSLGLDHEAAAHPSLHRRIFGCGSTPSLPHSDYVSVAGTYRSDAMGGVVPWEVALPAEYATPSHAPSGPPLPLVLALPGLNGSPHSTVTTTGLPAWATQAGIKACFATPGAVASTYYHPRADGTDAFAWVTEELLGLVERRFHVGGSKARRTVYGSSMGGFGALLVGLKRPDLVCAVVGAAPAVFPSYHAAITGHPDTFDSAADWQRWGFWTNAASMAVPTRIDCGSGDPFASTARDLLRVIPGAVGGIDSGCHVESFWRRNATTELRFLASHLSSA